MGTDEWRRAYYASISDQELVDLGKEIATDLSKKSPESAAVVDELAARIERGAK